MQSHHALGIRMVTTFYVTLSLIFYTFQHVDQERSAFLRYLQMVPMQPFLFASDAVAERKNALNDAISTEFQAGQQPAYCLHQPHIQWRFQTEVSEILSQFRNSLSRRDLQGQMENKLMGNANDTETEEKACHTTVRY